MSRLCSLVKMRHASLATLSSAAARKPGSASRMTTFEPSRRHTLPSSSPITPAPITPSRSGTSVNASAPTLSQTSAWSTGTPGRWRALEPVATMTAFASATSASRRRRSPRPASHSAPRPTNLPWPLSQTILFLRKSVSMPFVIFETIPSLRAIIFAMSIFGAGHGDAVIGEAVERVLVLLGGFEQRLRRDAADVEAGSAERPLAGRVRPFLDAGGLQAELGGADRGDVAGRTGADDDDVERLCHGFLDMASHRGHRDHGAAAATLCPLGPPWLRDARDRAGGGKDPRALP